MKRRTSNSGFEIYERKLEGFSVHIQIHQFEKMGVLCQCARILERYMTFGNSSSKGRVYLFFGLLDNSTCN